MGDGALVHFLSERLQGRGCRIPRPVAPTLRQVSLSGMGFARHGISVIAPDSRTRAEIDRIIFDELCKAVFLPASKRFYLAAMAEMAERVA